MSDNVLKIIKAIESQVSIELRKCFVMVFDAEAYGCTELEFETEAEAAQAYADFQKLIEGVVIDD